MPHGLFNAYLWSCFDPLVHAIEAEYWREIFNQTTSWTLVPESPSEPSFVPILQTKDLTVPLIDAYLLPEMPDLGVLAVGHEPPHYWHVPSGQKARPRKSIKSGCPPESGSYRLETTNKLTPTRSKSVLRDAKSLIRSKFGYCPRYTFARSGVCKDFLWNYIPRSASLESLKESVVPQLLHSSRELVVWADDDIEFLTTDKLSIEELVSFQNAYIADHPEMRWLLAIPEHYIEGSKDNDFKCSLVFR